MSGIEENDGAESNIGHSIRTEEVSAVEDTDEGSTGKDDLNVELPPKKKRNVKGKGSNEELQDKDYSGIDEDSSGGAVNEKESSDSSDVNYLELDNIKSRRSRTTELRHSNVNEEEEESDSDDESILLKKGSKSVKKRNPKKTDRKSKKGKGRKMSSKTEEDQNEGESDYEVEKIIDVKYTSKGKREFLLRWKGFSSKDDTWEPEENLDCQYLVKQYFKNKESRRDADSDEEEGKNSGLRKRFRESSGARTRSRGGENKKAENKNNVTPVKKSYERASRSSPRVSKGNIAVVALEDEHSSDEEKEKQSRKTRGRPGDNKRKRESGSDSVEKTKRNKKDQNKENLDESRVPSDDSGTEEETGEYEVQKILDVRHLKNGSREFFIKWKGFSSDYNSWEPEKHLNCSDKLKEFLQELEKVSSLPIRELRCYRKKTDRLIIESPRTRKLSTRIQRQPRKSYIEVE